MQLPKFVSKLFQSPPPVEQELKELKQAVNEMKAGHPLMTELMPRDSIFFSFMHTPFNPDVLVGKKGGLLIYEKMRQDDTIKACLNLKKYAVLSSGWTIEHPKDADKAETEASEFILYNLQHMEGTFDDDLLEIMTGFEYGFSCSEKIFQVMDSTTPYSGKIGIKAIKTRKPHWIDIKTDKFGNIEEDGIIQNRTSNYPKNKFILYTHDKTFDNPYGESDLRACYRAWWSKDVIIKFWNMWLERFGTPPVIGKITEALESGDEAALKEIFKNLTSKTSMLLPKGVEVDIPEIRGMGAQAYQKAIEAHDMAIARALLVPSLLGVTQQGNTGSYAQSKTHFNVFIWIIEKLRRTLEELINEQLVREVLNYNFHLENYPRFAFIPLNEDKKMELAKLYIDAISKGAITPTLQDENVFRNLLDLPEKTKEEVEKEKPIEEKLLPEEEKQFGGPGSGHHGHAGRPGTVGGSGSGGGEADLVAINRELSELPKSEYIVDDKKIRTDDESRKEFYNVLQKQYPNGIPCFHEAPISALEGIKKDGLTSGESAGDTNFATIGKPSEFIISNDKLIVKFTCGYPPGAGFNNAKLLSADMRYDAENPHADLLKSHKGVFGADVAYNRNVSKAGIDYIAIVRDGKITEKLTWPFGTKIKTSPYSLEKQFFYNRELTTYEKKVDFKQIEDNLNTLEINTIEQLVEILTKQKQAIVNFLTSKIQKGELDQALVNNLQLKYQLQLQQTIREMLRESFTLGKEDAKKEIGTAKNYKVKIPPVQAIEWFEKKSFYVKNILNEQLLKQIKQALITAMEIGEPLSETMAKIENIYEPFLGDDRVIVDEEQPKPYRIETLVRTNSTAAMNWGRMAMYNDPELEGFVEACQFSAILDTRTTDICRHLDGKIIKMSDPDISRVVPPLHFNCRSILIAVTLADPPYTPIKRSEMNEVLETMQGSFGGRLW